MLTVDPHPLAHCAVIAAQLPAPLEALPSPEWLQALLRLDAPAPVSSGDPLRAAIRDLLRHGGYKPTGRGKPASEYLLRAAADGLASINAAVDVCNAVSLHSGLPISVIDQDRAKPPFRIGLAPAGASYVFNASGQTIELGGLLCLFDQDGPCANAVKDSQRTKTSAQTRRTLSVLWGARGLETQVKASADWYRQLLARLGAQVSDVAG